MFDRKVPQAAQLADLNAQLTDLDAQLARASTATSKKSLTDQTVKLKAEREKLLADQQANAWEPNPTELGRSRAAKKIAVSASRSSSATVVAITEGGVPEVIAKRSATPRSTARRISREGAIVPRRFPVILAGESQTPLGERTSQSGRRELAEWSIG
jgi:hypothetical protein